MKVLVVEDDKEIVDAISLAFQIRWPEAKVVSTRLGQKGVELVETEVPDIVILDYHLNSINKKAINGLEALDKIKALNPQIPVIMLSSQDKIDVAVNCMKHQAFDYIVKSETAFIRLQKAITSIFHYQKIEKALSWYMEKM